MIEFENGNLTVDKINYVANENKLYFTGPVKGKSGKTNFVADNGVYNNLTGILKIDGNIKINNDTGKFLSGASYAVPGMAFLPGSARRSGITALKETG